ncbi:unnamed protein product [marine sediment metagenome]|uniref:Uncharacterized protein n=1 Tax=marine sediment metagenome TaxID=412755 RepID=X1HIG9_9ZZZZ
MAYSPDKHDIGLVRTDGTEIGLMLARDKNDIPQYYKDDDPFLPNQFLTGVPGYGNLPPEKQVAIRGDDWRHGFGQQFYSTEKDKAYWSSIGADGRFRGMAVAGMKASTVTKPSLSVPTATIGNAGFEDWSNGNPDDWTETEKGTAQEAGVEDSISNKRWAA